MKIRIKLVDAREGNWGLTLDWVIQEDSLRRWHLCWDPNGKKEPVMPRERALQAERITEGKDPRWGWVWLIPGAEKRQWAGAQCMKGVVQVFWIHKASDAQQTPNERRPTGKCVLDCKEHRSPVKSLFEMQMVMQSSWVEPKILHFSQGPKRWELCQLSNTFRLVGM